jgi:hypothetical protein
VPRPACDAGVPKAPKEATIDHFMRVLHSERKTKQTFRNAVKAGMIAIKRPPRRYRACASCRSPRKCLFTTP